MAVDPALPPSDVASSAATAGDIDGLQRRPQFTQQAMPFAPIGGTPRDNGYWSTSSAVLFEITRSDVVVTAPVLDYDFQISAAYASSAPTSISYQITLKAADASFADVVLLSGSGADGQQIAGRLNIFTATTILADIFTRIVSFRLAIARVGGSGDAAAARMDKPWFLLAHA